MKRKKYNKEREKSIKEIIYFILIFLILYSFFTFGLKTILATDIPLAVVESGSMKPALNIGDIIIVKGVDPKEIKVNDIIVFKKKYSNITIVHRVVKIINDGGELKFKTKGDNNPYNDPGFVKEDEIKGKVIFKIPYIGYLTLFFQKNPSIYILVILLLISLIIVSFFKQKEKK